MCWTLTPVRQSRCFVAARSSWRPAHSGPRGRTANRGAKCLIHWHGHHPARVGTSHGCLARRCVCLGVRPCWPPAHPTTILVQEGQQEDGCVAYGSGAACAVCTLLLPQPQPVHSVSCQNSWELWLGTRNFDLLSPAGPQPDTRHSVYRGLSTTMMTAFLSVFSTVLSRRCSSS
jgi:hypothetical protein